MLGLQTREENEMTIIIEINDETGHVVRASKLTKEEADTMMRAVWAREDAEAILSTIEGA